MRDSFVNLTIPLVIEKMKDKVTYTWDGTVAYFIFQKSILTSADMDKMKRIMKMILR